MGSWFGAVPLGQFTDLISFHHGGLVTESRRYLIPGTPLGNLLETTGHGAWNRTKARSFEALFRFLLQNADSRGPMGTDNVRLVLALNRRGDALEGTFTSQIKGVDDVVSLTVTGDYSATRIDV